MIKLFLFILAFFTLPAQAQNQPRTFPASNENMVDSIRQLRQEVNELRQEVKILRQNQSSGPAAANLGTSPSIGGLRTEDHGGRAPSSGSANALPQMSEDQQAALMKQLEVLKKNMMEQQKALKALE